MYLYWRKKCFISIFIFVFYGFFVIKILRGKIKIEIIFKVWLNEYKKKGNKWIYRINK